MAASTASWTMLFGFVAIVSSSACASASSACGSRPTMSTAVAMSRAMAMTALINELTSRPFVFFGMFHPSPRERRRQRLTYCGTRLLAAAVPERSAAEPRTGSAPRSVLGHGGVPMVTAGAQMSGDPLALEKDLDSPRGQLHLDFDAGEAIRDAVKVAFELDMVVDADPTQAPLGKAIGLCRRRGEVRAIQLFEEDLPGDTEPPDRALIIELAE